jgi:cell division protein FtsI/penicillin-binding protein 2
MRIRFFLLISSLFLAFSFLTFHIYKIQIQQGKIYLAKAESQYLASGFLKPNRGSIFFTDKDGKRSLVATNKNLPTVYAEPKNVDDPAEAANILTSILSKPVSDLFNKLSKKNDSYELLLRKGTNVQVKEINSLSLKGIYTLDVPERFYPFGNLASQVLGYVGPNENDLGEAGHYGLEEYFENKLSGKPGETNDGKIISPESGEDIMLTIDLTIQKEAEKILNRVVKDHGASGGSVIVMDPLTGKVLAMGSTPSFDPNDYGKTEISNFKNPVVQEVYEPGSVFKVITMAAGIDSGKITPETKYTDYGFLTLNGRRIENYDLKKRGAYGTINMTTVIENSINTGAVFAQGQTGREIFTEYIKLFGFGEKTDIALPGEVKGNISRLSPKEKDIAFATASYGQGVAVTSLEVIRAMAAIANGGKLVSPYILEGSKTPEPKTILKEDTAKKVTQMMVSAVDKAGVAKISGYSIAGKTGTAFIPDFKYGGYTDKVIDTYVGFGPTLNPRFIILFKVNDLHSTQLASLIVVPAFRDLAEFIINYYNIPPDRL